MDAIFENKTLLIVSHTEHFRGANGEIVGWGPTVREINFLASHFKSIVHIACLHHTETPPGLLSYKTANIRFVPIPPFGGKRITDKLKIFIQFASIIRTIKKEKGTADYLQIRLPMGFGNLLLPYFIVWRPQNKFWVKYAGNWMQEKAPLGYRFQKYILSSNLLHCPVTINGKWEGMPGHIHAFENPCINEEEFKEGTRVIQRKIYASPLTGIFIGRLEPWKGIDRLLDALPILRQKGFEVLHVVGGGAQIGHYRERVERNDYGVKVLFHDYLPFEKIATLLAVSHILFLPSDSEGFPKVVAEAANFGCIPVVSNVSSIPQYVNARNGYLWEMEKHNFSSYLEDCDFAEEVLVSKAVEIEKLRSLFTFSHYLKHLSGLW